MWYVSRNKTIFYIKSLFRMSFKPVILLLVATVCRKVLFDYTIKLILI